MQVAKHYITTWWLGGRFNGTGREIDFVPVRGIWNQSVTCIYLYIYTHIFLVSLDIPLCLSISRHVWSNTWSFLLPQIPGILQSWLPAAVRFWAKTIQDSCDESCGIVLRFFVDFAIAGSSVNAKMWGIQTDTTRCSCTWGSLRTQSHESCLKWYAFLAFMIYLLLQPVRHRLEACKIENAGVAANTLRLFC